MPAPHRIPNRTQTTAAPLTLGVTRMVLAQMVGCGILGWVMFAVAVERWLPSDNSQASPTFDATTHQVSVKAADSISVKSAQFQVSEPDKTR